VRNHELDLRIVGWRFRIKAAKFFRMMVARDGVERFRDPCFQQLADSTKDTKDTKDRFSVRSVCDFSLAPLGEIGRRRAKRKPSQSYL